MICNVIASGSRGNAVVLDGTILMGCGVPFRALEGVCDGLWLVVLTHIHGDHFNPETIKRLAFLRPTLRFLCPPWMHQALSSCGIYETVIDESGTDDTLSYGRLPGGSYSDIQFRMTPVPHDVPNCAWHIYGWRGGRSEAVFYATDCGRLDGVDARDYDLYLIGTGHGGEESPNLSRKQAEAWMAENAGQGRNSTLLLPRHKE